jgi:hypothetical protein
MAPNTTTPSALTRAFKLPPSATELHQSRNEVSWSTIPKEMDAEMIEKRKMPITYSIVVNLSLITVFKLTLTILQATNPSFILISYIDSTVTLRNTSEANKISTADIKKYFPAKISGNKVHCKVFFLSLMPIHLLKKSTFGFYKWVGRKVWIFQSHAMDVRNIGFIIYWDPKKTNRDSYLTELALALNYFPLSEEDAPGYNNAKDAETFDGGLPKFYLQQSERVQSHNVHGKVTTHAITIHCQNSHQGFMAPFIT